MFGEHQGYCYILDDIVYALSDLRLSMTHLHPPFAQRNNLRYKHQHLGYEC